MKHMRFIHTADIHLGAQPDRGREWSRQRGEEIWESFRLLIREVKERKADLLLISGDLFHRQPLKKELREVDYLFSTLAPTQVVLMAGNHDHIRKDSYYRDFPWSRNVVFLGSRKLQSVRLPRLHVCVYGCSYYDKEVTEPLYDHVRPQNSSDIHILLAHGGDDRHSPISFSQLSQAGFDYVALGHIHRPQIMKQRRMAYAGALEPIDKNDFGDHGYVEGEIKEGRTRLKFHAFAKRSYVPLEIQVTPKMTQHRLEDILKEEIRQTGEQHSYQISLVGTRHEEISFDLGRLYRLGRIVGTEDYTEPYIDVERLLEQYEGTVLGEYVKRFADQPEGVQLKALHYGLMALLKTKNG